METKGKRAAIYCRVSTSAQAEDGTSLDSQEEKCRAYCKQNGYNVLGVYREEGVSGATLARPELDRVRDLVRDGLVDVVVVYALDRLSRDAGHTLLLVKEFQDRGAALKSATVPIEQDPAGQLLLTMLSGFAQFERAQILERSRRGKEATTRKGKVVLSSARPYGFRNIYGEARLEGIEEELAVVKRIFDMVTVEHLSLRRIARRLNEEGVPTATTGAIGTTGTSRLASKGWVAETLRGILKNPIYTGKLAWGKQRSFAAPTVPADPQKPGTPTSPSSAKQRRLVKARPESEWLVVENALPRLISDEQFSQVQAVFARNREMAANIPVKPYLLRGHIYCGECGKKMRCHHNWRRQHSYQCLTPDATTPHKGRKTWLADEIESDVWMKLRATLGDAEVLRTLATAEQPTQEQENEVAELAAALVKAKEKLAKTDQQADDLLEMYLKGTLVKSQFEKVMQGVNDTRAQVEAQIAEIEDLTAQYGIGPGQSHATLLDAATWITLCAGVSKQLRLASHQYSFDEQRRLLDAVKARVTIFPNETRLAWVFTPAVLDVEVEAEVGVEAAPEPKLKPGERANAIYHALVNAQTGIAKVQQSAVYL
jgi:site-specific DNA recombinase